MNRPTLSHPADVRPQHPSFSGVMIDEPLRRSHASTRLTLSPVMITELLILDHRRRCCKDARAPFSERDARSRLALRARGSQSGEGRALIDRGMLELFFISRI